MRSNTKDSKSQYGYNRKDALNTRSSRNQKDYNRKEVPNTRTTAEQALYKKRKAEGTCYKCGGDHLARNHSKELKIREIATSPERYAPAVHVPVSINGMNVKAYVDSGSSHCFIAPHLVGALKLKIEKYNLPQKLELGTKGSRAMINHYCRANIGLQEVKTPYVFDIANTGDKICTRKKLPLGPRYHDRC